MGDQSNDPRDVIVILPEDAEAMLRAAVDSYSAGKLSHAETILAGLIALKNDDARPVKVLASCMLLQQRHREAEAMYERALGLDADDPYTLVALAEIKLKALKVEDAISLLERLFALDPERSHPAANRGRQQVREFHARLAKAK